MRQLRAFFTIVISLFILTSKLYAQITIKGQITDVHTGSPVPYATVTLSSPRTAAPTDFEGNYQFNVRSLPDSIGVAYIGYHTKKIAVPKSINNIVVLNIQIASNSTMLEEIQVGTVNKENPAWRILRQVIRHKAENNFQHLKAYQYESYNRIELSATNFNEKLRKKKIVRQMLPLLDSLKKVAGEDGVANLPIFISESYSENFFKRNPFKKRENILKTRVKGIGFEDGTLLSQLVGSTFLQHNFYKNFISVAGKQFISPISDNWRLFYDYTLEDTNSKIDSIACFKITFKPKSESDLAFTGTMWISKDSYALCQLASTINSEANLNFINKVEIQQESKPFNGIWFPSKSRILIKIAELTKNTPGLIAQFYLNNSKLKITEPQKDDFFETPIVVNDSATIANELFWAQKTPPNLSITQQNIYHMIDTLKSLPAVKTYIDMADMILNGYYKIGKIGLGPYLFSYARNDIEGNRFRLGFKTNYDFSKRLVLEPYIAYGDRDERFKYGINADYIINRKPWTQTGISFSHDLNQVALLSENYNYANNNLFNAFSRFGNINQNRKVFMQNKWSTYISSDVLKNVNLKVQFDRWSFNPQFGLDALKNPSKPLLNRNFATTEVKTQIRWSPGVITLQSENKNKPVTVKSNSQLPTFTFRYTLGLKNILNSDLNYQKFSMNISQKLRLGIFGKGAYSLTGGYIPSVVPYQILENHLGNNTFFYNKTSFNTMRFFEFMSDRYASLMYTQHFEGLFFNRIPLLKKLNLRELGTFNILYGNISDKNISLYKNSSLYSKGLNPKIPYMELGYGVENICKFLRIDFIHRLNYLDNNLYGLEKPKKFAIKLSAQIRL